MVRVAVAGAGAFGRNHLRVYRELETSGLPVSLVAAIEPDQLRADETTKTYGIPVYASVDGLLRADLKIDAASVAVPTVYHHAVAAQLLEAGLDVLVEKPLAASLTEADELLGLAEKNDRILQPGHLERFNPAVLAVQPKLRRPMFFEAHRLSVFSPRALDVDVVLDLMIHDLDIVLTFANSEVREVRAVGLPILSPKVDIANVRVEFESGCVANFTASRVSTERVRKLRFFEPRQYVSIDYARRDLLVIRLDGTVPAEIAAALEGGKLDPALLAQLAAGAAAGGPNPGLSFAKPTVLKGEPLRLEIESFLESVRTRKAPRVTARQGRDALALALEIQSTMAAHAVRAGLQDFFEPAGA
jgi:predicted dehydrogenase